jgi:hypothetical protein
MRKFLLFVFISASLSLCTFVPQAQAHAFGQQYTLPLPAWLYIYGGAITVILSFVLAGFFIQPPKKTTQKNSSTFPLNFSLPPLLLTTSYLLLKTLSVFFLLFSILSGFIGVDIGVLNFNMTYFWIILVIGGVYLSALIGNWWSKLNPWMSMINAAEWLMQDSLTGIFPYPNRLRYTPSILFAFLLMVFELIFQTTPFTLSILLFVYTTTTLSGMILFGKEEWNEHAEVFTVYFGLIAKLCPFSITKNKLSFHLPGYQILLSPIGSSGLLIFILTLLAGTAFDGFKESADWFRLYYSFLHIFEFLFPISTYQCIEILFYLSLIGGFISLYFVAIWLTQKISKHGSTQSLALSYAGTLIPILLGYNLAHYFSLVLIQGQAFISLISDPFGFGWNLLGTASYKPNINLISLTTIWHLQVAAIIIGHILAVILSHLVGSTYESSKKQMLLAQIPLLTLMIFYTMGGLWLLSLPLN